MRKQLAVLVVILLSSSLYSQTNEEAEIPSSSNATSRGSSTMSGAGDGPMGPGPSQKQEARKRAQSMGGAPNVGGGMGTGTGAGSTVGPETGRGVVSAGAMGGAEEEMYDPDKE